VQAGGSVVVVVAAPGVSSPRKSIRSPPSGGWKTKLLSGNGAPTSQLFNVMLACGVPRCPVRVME